MKGTSIKIKYFINKKLVLVIFHRFIASCYQDVLELLLNHGADPNLTNNDGENALMIGIILKFLKFLEPWSFAHSKKK